MCCRCLGRLCMHDCLSFAAGNVRRILHMASVGNDYDTTNKTGNYYLLTCNMEFDITQAVKCFCVNSVLRFN